jgi:hypothetical protein
MKPEGFNVRGALLKLTTSIFTIFHISPIGLPGFCPNHSVLSSNVIGVMPRPYLPTNPQYQKLISPPLSSHMTITLKWAYLLKLGNNSHLIPFWLHALPISFFHISWALLYSINIKNRKLYILKISPFPILNPLRSKYSSKCVYKYL